MTAMRPTGGNVSTNGTRTHVLRYRGPGAPLLLVPGITSPAITWGFVAERLAQVFDTFVVDVRGRGLSSSGPGLDYGLDAMADDLSTLIAALKVENVTVLGHSMGARIAIRAAVRDASSMARLVLVDPPVSGPGRRPYPAKLSWYLDSIRLAVEGMDADAMRAFCPTWSEEQLGLRAEWLHTCFEPAIVAAFEGFHTDDIHKDLRQLALPVALMIAGRGGVIEAADEAEIAALNPAIRTTRVSDAGHMIPWDDFDGFFQALDVLLGTSFGRSAA
ncbi:alpha/beta fold hydrolase [Bradyrhizobium erythrophlei]|jgi:N-formylmaleamate deformylase|nr:alpha/beta hydrolase [Bradyrhizobium erythrophlei]